MISESELETSFNVSCNQIRILLNETWEAASDSSSMYLWSQQVQAKAFIIISLSQAEARVQIESRINDKWVLYEI